MRTTRGVSRALVGQLEAVLQKLSGPEISDEGAHDVRKALKRARASLRLLRDPKHEAVYRRHNLALRDAARPFAPLRDAKVLIELIDGLAPEADRKSAKQYEQIREALQKRRRRLRPRVSANLKKSTSLVRRVLRERAKSVDRTEADLIDNLKGTYQRARDAFQEARERPDDEKLHELRKQVKYLFYQLEILRPRKAKRLVNRADEFGKVLGEDHDLAVLAQKVEPSALERRERAKLQRRANRIAKRLLRVKPGRFARELAPA